jgi:hypothetical protein
VTTVSSGLVESLGSGCGVDSGDGAVPARIPVPLA